MTNMTCSMVSACRDENSNIVKAKYIYWVGSKEGRECIRRICVEYMNAIARQKANNRNIANRADKVYALTDQLLGVLSVYARENHNPDLAHYISECTKKPIDYEDLHFRIMSL